MKTLAIGSALALAATLAAIGPALAAAAAKGPRLGFDGAAVEDRMMPPEAMAPDMMTTGSISAHRPFSVVFLNDLAPTDPMRRTVEQNSQNPVHRAAARGFVSADPAIAAQLRAQSLDETNIVGIGKDGDGNDVIYVR